MSSVAFKLPAGIKVKDTVHGIVGTITQRIQRINGCVQYCVDPACDPAKPNVMPEGYYLDAEVLTPVGKKKAFGTESHDFKFETGDRLKNRVTGAKGIVTIRRLDMNGCESYFIVSGLDKEGKKQEHWGFVQEWEKIDNGLNKKTEKPLERKATGCSASAAHRF